MQDETKPLAELVEIDPGRLMNNFIRLGIVSIIVILVLTSYGIYRVFSARIIANAELNSINLASALIEHFQDNLIINVGDDVYELRVTESAFKLVDKNFRNYLHHFNVIKIKIYDRHAKIVYSTNRSLVGKIDRNNQRLANAIAGRNDSKVVNKEKVLDLNGTEKFNVDVVETYVPVRDVKGHVLGCFELYEDVTPHYRSTVKIVSISAGIMFFIMVWVYLVSYIIIRKEAIQLVKIQETLRSQANTDALTGICNRRYLLTRCVEEMERLQRRQEESEVEGSISFIMIDIDHFKKVNDTYGHAAGDEILRGIAARLLGVLRKYDLVGRYGGEEFLVVLPGTDREQIRVVAEKLWESVRAAPFNYNGQPIEVTISLGGATTSGHDDDDYEYVIKRADDALYRAKSEGRDKISYV